MHNTELHTFHIPVMGLGYTIDTPVKVARFGISSVVSIIEDNLVELMRKFYCEKTGEPYSPILKEDLDHRAQRITEYLNLINKIVRKQFIELKAQSFGDSSSDIVKYFELIPESSPLKKFYLRMLMMEDGNEKVFLQKELRSRMKAGAIDVNIMTKCDRTNTTKSGERLPPEYADAMAALRGFALSDLTSSVVFSAGLNPRLYSYCESFSDFYPDENGSVKKKIILKVSDYRSAFIQGKLFAKKGIWISEYRIESGLNCGGHVFATDGLLLGPILDEFKSKRAAFVDELFELCSKSLMQKNIQPFPQIPEMRITVQGGIGTSNENSFLHEYYKVNGTGWGSPFLLVPEVTNVDAYTLNQLVHAQKEDFYLSYASPLGIPFSNFRKSSAEAQRKNRIEKGRPGSACYKKYLSFNTEFGEEAICSSSREYQNLKIKKITGMEMSTESFEKEFDQVTEKDCLCEGLAASVLVKNNIEVPHELEAVTICPGPNLAYFSNISSLREMVNHIYGRINILNSVYRSNMFINELNLYVDYLKNEIERNMSELSERQSRYYQTFKTNLLQGIEYYKNLIPHIGHETDHYLSMMRAELHAIEDAVHNLVIPEIAVEVCP